MVNRPLRGAIGWVVLITVPLIRRRARRVGGSHRVAGAGNPVLTLHHRPLPLPPQPFSREGRHRSVIELAFPGTAVLVVVLVTAMILSGATWRFLGPPIARNDAAAVTGAFHEGVPEQRVDLITIVPGWRAEQVAQMLDNSGVGDGALFLELVREPQRLVQGASEWANLPSLEGFLLPGTYEVDPFISERGLLADMIGRFDEAFTDAMRAQARELGLSVPEVVTLASIVEREAVLPGEAPVIAGVFHNRLRAGMPLESDPTVAYVVDTEKGPARTGYWRWALRTQDLRSGSPYNTYTREGLPSGPIANPSINTIKAVLYPADFDYLYFVANGNGTHQFATTLAEHNANIQNRGSLIGRPDPPDPQLQRLVELIMGPAADHVGVVVQNLTTGAVASWHADDFFTAAHLEKLAIMWAAFTLREQGEISFDRRLSISLAALAQDLPETRARLTGNPTVGGAIEEMIVGSSSAATEALFDELGRPTIERLLREEGILHTSLMAEPAVTTPEDVARLLGLIATGGAAGEQAGAEMSALLALQPFNNRLPRYLPAHITLAHQTGDLESVSHDAGILYTADAELLIVAMTERIPSRDTAVDAIARLGRVVYDYFESYLPAEAELAAHGNPACPANPFGSSTDGPLSGRRIVLDPGHGGTDPGTEYEFDDGFVLQEKLITLEVAIRLRDLLVERGATVLMTRCEDTSMSRPARAALANDSGADVVVSLHVDSYDGSILDKTTVYAFTPSGQTLAEHVLGSPAHPALWDALRRSLHLANGGVELRAFDVIVFSKPPAVLTESVMMNHPAEAAALREALGGGPGSRIEEIARGHLAGLLQYFVPASDPSAGGAGATAAVPRTRP